MKGLFIPGITAEMFRSGCLEQIEALMSEGEIYDIEYEPKWIPVSERLPEDSRSVLIYTKEGGVAEGKYSKRTESWIQFRWSVPYAKVLAWMPLPEPYKEAQE